MNSVTTFSNAKVSGESVAGRTGFAMEAPKQWRRAGLVLARSKEGIGKDVLGDPCVVWDDTIPGWRMILFCHPPGHAQAICRSAVDVGPGNWEFLGPLEFTNPSALPAGFMHKPYVVQDAYCPNRAAKIGGRYMLLGVANMPGDHKYVHRAWATQLAGPWTWDAEALIPPGKSGEFDERHVDAVTGIYFPDRHECLYYYMGYPQKPQPHSPSPLGSAQGLAVETMADGCLRKVGAILQPARQPGHWAAGYVGGLQPLPGKSHRWVAIVGASPTPPRPDTDKSHSREEPAPSLAGFAFCDQEYPVRCWYWDDQPVEWIEDIPPAAIAAGEGVNLWRHYILALSDGRVAMYYNTGSYGQEQLYMKWAIIEP